MTELPIIPALPHGVTFTTLDNGLTVIIREDHSAPVVSVQAWAMTGSIHESRWLGAGLSHVLEHMLFKGTTTRPGSRIDQEVQEAGGYMNAYGRLSIPMLRLVYLSAKWFVRIRYYS